MVTSFSGVMLFESPDVSDFTLNDNSGTKFAPGGYSWEREEVDGMIDEEREEPLRLSVIILLSFDVHGM
jgi:hypothetical protein